ncbi:RagB/SusD family nutrient uptake outer membrane protein [Lutibacter sp. B1]|uniref:RagB/SusD family nutrient uptake outer membrane protein n=1 Tax=Lutibacter sp. B1 TaxID=2725996 RepID=UPI001457700F|nr:RagB/SusD family nutrient uptake outer membrane protein [Lutibacter sp. B1]NLP56832.1 RagB/SusD family nutrient uptake outer membrane protein [Lutibacter sp. B1]
MKYIYKIIVVLVVSFTLYNCTDLESDVSDFIPGDEYPENSEQAIRVANPVFTKTQSMLDGGGWWFLQEVTSDEAVAPTRGSDWDDGGKWRVLHNHTWGNTTEAVNQLWGLIYDAVPRANRAIELLEVNADNEEVATVLAQTIVARAYYYYLAIDNYGAVPFPRTFTGANEFPSRTPRAEVFNTIVQDILDNIDKLPTPTPGVASSSINQGTAYALLAKLYLNAEVYTGTPMWAETIDACNNVIGLGYELEVNPLDAFKTDNGASKENIYTIAYDEDKFTGFNFHMRTLHYLNQQTFNISVQPWNGFAILESTYNLFESSDLRTEGLLVGQQYAKDGSEIFDDVAGVNLILTPEIPALLIDANTYSMNEIRNSGVRVAKWEIKEGAKGNLSNDFAIFSLPDIILTKAEAMVRLGQNGDALVNQIKQRANAPITGNYSLNDILDERGRELLWQGYRRQDLIRFGEFNKEWDFKNPSAPTRNIFPVPQFAINANDNLLPQNSGY